MAIALPVLFFGKHIKKGWNKLFNIKEKPASESSKKVNEKIKKIDDKAKFDEINKELSKDPKYKEKIDKMKKSGFWDKLRNGLNGDLGF